jgi:hypothetical protein
MRPCADCLSLMPDERCREVARILAGGVRRLRSRAAIPADPIQYPDPEIPADSSRDCLELSAQPRLSVHSG